MAAPMANALLSGFKRCISLQTLQVSQRNMGFINNLRRKITRAPEPEVDEVIRIEEGEDEVEDMEVRTKRKCIEEVRPYQPPADLEERIQRIVELNCGPMDEWKNMQFSHRVQKYELLTSLIEEFDHDIPNVELFEMENLGDVINYFKTPIQDASAYTDIANLDLPKNVHFNMEPYRFNEENDPLKRQTAFPEMKTIVTSVKYRRKYREPHDESHPIRGRPIGVANWK